MDTKTTQTDRVSAIIPAFNESATVEGVIHMIENHPLIDEIIVVDDGSTDDTADQARKASARVIVLPENQGKAAAMSRGVEAARNDIIFFVDADIHGLSRETISALIEPVRSGRIGMFVAIRDRNLYLLNRLLRFTPILGGERVLTKELWYSVPDEYKQKFQIEIALNYYAKQTGLGMGFTVAPGLDHVKKEKKWGFWYGLGKRILMFLDLLVISSLIYLFAPLRRATKRPERLPRAHLRKFTKKQ